MTQDLFETPELLPKKVQDLIMQQGDFDYESLAVFLDRMNRLGYTFQYGLDAQPFNLKKIKIK